MRSQIQLCYPFEQKRLDKWKPPYIIQPKLDGERCRAVWNHELDTWQLLSSECNIITSVPHINEALLHYPTYNEYDGELYYHELPFEDIHSIVSRKVNQHSEFEKMEYHIFDIINDDPQALRLINLNRLGSFGPVKVVNYEIAEDFDGVMESYHKFLGMNYEGMIVRHPGANYIRKRSVYMLKFKPKKSDYYKIIGCNEEIDKNGFPKGSLGSFTCVSEDEATEFNVGSGFTKLQREEYWEIRHTLVNQICHVEYQNITSGKGVPRFPIFMEVIVV